MLDTDLAGGQVLDNIDPVLCVGEWALGGVGAGGLGQLLAHPEQRINKKAKKGICNEQ